ncbi:MFGE8 [Branchiostoma lanceolatum]|uniref:MFGE8 protein n=1 Tax=Branchiostoma lanceolatum TaxID=7740 RepID=A0A8K0ELX4_BRALA|nr:MFGE8 [Branchiostoma lanceolatum]
MKTKSASRRCFVVVTPRIWDFYTKKKSARRRCFGSERVRDQRSHSVRLGWSPIRRRNSALDYDYVGTFGKSRTNPISHGTPKLSRLRTIIPHSTAENLSDSIGRYSPVYQNLIMKISVLLVVCLASAACSKNTEDKEKLLQDLREMLGLGEATCAFGERPAVDSRPWTTSCSRCVAVPLGMQNGAIRDSQITASSTHPDCATSTARLHFEAKPTQSQPGWAGAWCSGSPNANEWLQIDLGSEMPVAGVITQGRSSLHHSSVQHVTSYKLRFSTDGSTWSTYTTNLGQEKVFTGNSDQETEVRNLLDGAITTRYVRFWPQTWQSYVSMRVEILGLDCV